MFIFTFFWLTKLDFGFIFEALTHYAMKVCILCSTNVELQVSH